MGKTYADTLPLPFAVGGPNEGIGDFADGLDADPPLETHKNDLNLIDHHVSRLDALRAFARRKTVRAVAILAMVSPVVACATQSETDGQGGGTVAESTVGPSPSTNETEAACGPSRFEAMSVADQAECRELIAGMETADINKLSGLDQARWASYYRHMVLGEKSVLHTVIRAKTLEQPGSAESVALRFITDYQNSVFTLAWHLQNKPQVGTDPRTARALLGTDDQASDGYKAALSLKDSATGSSLEEFVQGASQSNRLFQSLFPEEPAVKKEGSDFVVTFTALSITGTGTKPHYFTYRLYPYMDATLSNGEAKEQPDDPTDPMAAISIALGKPHLAGTPQIRDASA